MFGCCRLQGTVFSFGGKEASSNNLSELFCFLVLCWQQAQGAVRFVDGAVDFVTPLKKRRLARESLSVDGSLRSISEEEDSPSARTASPPDDVQPAGTISTVDDFTAVSANERRYQVTSCLSISYGYY